MATGLMVVTSSLTSIGVSITTCSAVIVVAPHSPPSGALLGMGLSWVPTGTLESGWLKTGPLPACARGPGCIGPPPLPPAGMSGSRSLLRSPDEQAHSAAASSHRYGAPPTRRRDAKRHPSPDGSG